MPAPGLTTLTSKKVTGGGGGGGGGGVAASIDDRTVSKSTINGTPASASYALNSNGNVYNHAGTNLETWLDSGVNTNFDCRATLVGGDTLSAGTLNTWQALSSSRSWALTADVDEDKSTTLTIEIRNSSTLAVLDSATITLTATATLV